MKIQRARLAGVLTVLCALTLAPALMGAHQDDGPWPPAGVYAAAPGNGVTLPRLVREVRPQYTSDAMRAQIAGTVNLGCVVEVDGTVGAIRVLRSLDRFYGLDDNAIKAAKQWRFQPGTKDGTVVPVAITIELTFTLASAPVLSWPESFVALPANGGDAPTWIDDELEAEGLAIHVSRPAAWRLKKDDGGSQLLALVGAAGRGVRIVQIERPKPATFQLTQPVPSATLQRVADAARRGVSRFGAEAQALAVGQVRASARLWVWYDLWLPVPTAEMTPNLPPEIRDFVQAVVDGARLWTFMTTEGQREIVVRCYAVKPHGATDAQWADEIMQAGAEFNGILQRISIRPQP